MSRFALLTAASFLWYSPLAARQEATPFDDRWRLSGEGSRIVPFAGRAGLELVSGEAVLPEIRMEDGTIDVDVRFPTQRSFVYLKFRMQSEDEFEEVYLRPHKSTLPDAIQYAPGFQGASAWQFYHGPGGAVPAHLPGSTWIRVRLVLQGRQAAFFVGDTVTPVLVVPRLARDPAPGYLALRSFIPAPIPQDVYGAHFANLVIRPGDIRYRFPPVTVPALRPGSITMWGVGRAFVPDSGSRQPIPPETIADGFRPVPVEPGKGFVLLHRHVPMPEGNRRVGVVARVIVKAASAGVYRFNLGFSDEASVYLNGNLLFTGDARYSFDQPRREGLIGLDQASLYLPLRAGDNELTVVVVDGFGGWGVMGQFEGAGLEIRPAG